MMKGLNFSIKLVVYREKGSNEAVFGPGTAELLEGIQITGSLNQATKRMNMAYSKAWKLLKQAEVMLGQPLLERKGPKGSSLTPFGEELLALYQDLNDQLCKTADETIKKYQ